jgi:hypothetical protein
MAYEIRPRSFGEIIDGAFQLYRNHFGVFLGISLIFGIPMNLVTGVLVGVARTTTANPHDPAAARAMLGTMASGLLLAFPVVIATYVLLHAALIHAISEAYLGRGASIGAAVKKALGRFGTLLGTGFVYGLIGAVCCLGLVVPGVIYFMNRCLYVQAIMIEGADVGGSLRRSKALMQGRRGRVFSLLLLFGLIQWALSAGYGAILPASVTGLPVVGFLIQQVPTFILSPVGGAIITLCYFDARVRDEGFDLEMLSRGALGAGPAAA